VAGLGRDPRLRRVHYDWLEAGEHTQRTVAQLSQQLRRFLDDRAWLENRRIMDILHGIEARAVALRESPPAGEVMTIAEPAAAIELPMERPLFTPPLRARIPDIVLEDGEDDLDAAALYAQVMVDKQRLARHIRDALKARAQVTLRELVDGQPLEHGLAELLAYLQLGSESFRTRVDEDTTDRIAWDAIGRDGGPTRREARVPRMIFVR
jgi:hypothetical protein